MIVDMSKSKKFGEILKGLMANKGISASAMARAIGVSAKTVHEWLGSDGRVPRDLDAVKKLADYFNCSTHYLLFGEEDPHSLLGEILNKTEVHSGLYEISIKKVITKK